jgi:hypothetical protein
MAKPKRKRRYNRCKYTLVEGPDGKYYLVSLTERPLEVQNQAEVATLLKDFEQTLSDIIKTRRMAAGSGVHISTVDVFPK